MCQKGVRGGERGGCGRVGGLCMGGGETVAHSF